jgi:hypothetical protein
MSVIYYRQNNDLVIYNGFRDEIISDIMKHHMIDRKEAIDRLDCSDREHPITLDNLEIAWMDDVGK